QSEYRPTEYLQRWVGFWFDEGLRLQAAKRIQCARLDFMMRQWGSGKHLQEQEFSICLSSLEKLVNTSRRSFEQAPSITHLLTEEARLTKKLYALASQAAKYGNFSREKGGRGADPANRFLDHGNYLAYGLGATATWVLGLPHGLAVLHGKTRRGGLVFDAADLVKDAIILPQAFISAARGDSDQEFRKGCLSGLTRSEALDFMIDTLKEIASELGRLDA
ncbi:MAG: type I-F CRISPR-associated endonuclease Cas1, partial [Chlamydiia bacterium]|nr:type I-F CRISPR-associated endonuclease Cas1 [Chlamydiia bacterium]